MITKEELISDIELRLTKGKPSDDLELSRRQIGAWIDNVRNELVAATLNQAIKRGEPLDSFYITKESCLSPTADNLSCVDEDNQEYLYTLSKEPMNLIKNQAIRRVITNSGETVLPSSIEEIEVIKDLPFSKPSECNFVYLREGNKLSFFGLNMDEAIDPDFIVYYIAEELNITEDADFPIKQELVAPLLDEVEAIGRRQMYNSAEDLENDGEQDI